MTTTPRNLQPGQVLDVLGDIVGHFAYDGDADAALPRIFVSFASFATADAHGVEILTSCACAGVDVTLACGKLTWDARACFAHGCLVYGLSPLYYDQEED